MKVIDHEPGAWFLLQEDQHYFLDVNCDRGAVGFSVTIQLTGQERECSTSGGRATIEDLANQVSARSDPLDPRDVKDPALRERMHRAIMTWIESHKD